jgi:hypothetical protein
MRSAMGLMGLNRLLSNDDELEATDSIGKKRSLY